MNLIAAEADANNHPAPRRRRNDKMVVLRRAGRCAHGRGVALSATILALSFAASAQEGARTQERCAAGEPTTAAGLPDRDADGIADAIDNCLSAANTDQRDTDGDAIGNACDADLDNNGVVNTLDLGLFKTVFFQTAPGLDADFDGDGTVALDDLGLLRNSFYDAPGPVGACIAEPAACAGPVDFEFDDVGEVTQGNLFVFRTSDPATIHHARRLISGASVCNPSVSGNTIRGTNAWNTAWGFQLDGDILFHGSSVEPLDSCDQTAAFINANLGVWCGDDATTACRFWCPWHSKMTREIL